MSALAKSLALLSATIIGTCALTATLFLVIRPCRIGAMTGMLFYGLSIPPALAFFVFRHRRTGHFWSSLGRTAALWAFLAVLLSVAISDLFGAIDRGRQKRAMAQLRDLGHSYERNRQAGLLTPSDEFGPIDPWGHPILIATTFTRYVLVSCGECGGPPEHPDLFAYPPGPTSRFDNDIVFSDGEFVAYPEGIQN